MQTRKATLPLLVALVLGLAPLGFGQLPTQTLSPHRTIGYYNSDTGLFEPLRPTEQDAEAPAVTPTTGTLTFQFTIVLKTPLPKNAVLTCTAGAAVIETNYSTDEGGFGIATLVSGTTYSCTATMHYSWLLNSPTTDKVILSYKANITEGIEVIPTNGTAPTVVTAGRFSSQTIASIKVPVSGATTTEDVSITL
jgi:hypothetical protein